MQVDLAIVGAGPAGLAFAQSMRNSGYSIALIDRQPLHALSEPQFDGREIALTHASRRILEDLGVWQRLDLSDVSQLRDAEIFNGSSLRSLKIDASLVGATELGYFVPNHLIRKNLFEAVQEQAQVQLVGGANVQRIERARLHNTLFLSDGRKIVASLVVAADSRYSETRRMMGIASDMHDFGRTMMVCRFSHEMPHNHISWQWFDYGQTLALLPLNGNRSNVVLTLPENEMQQLLALDNEQFSNDIGKRFAYRLGVMQKEGEALSYPLVGVYARSFVGHRYALVGDAAVGMHPVTAHGFNFGLQSQKRLAEQLWLAKRRAQDIGSVSILKAYERRHRAATLPLYMATNSIAQLFTSEKPVSRTLRAGALRIAQTLRPFRKVLAHHLTQA